MPLTEPLRRTAPSERRGGARRRGPERPEPGKRSARDTGPQAGRRPVRAPRPEAHQPAARERRALAVIGDQPPARTARTRDARPAADNPRQGTDRPPAKRTPRRVADTAATQADRPGRRRRSGRAADTTDKPRPSALRDVTRPIARDSRMAERRPVRIGYGLIAAAIGLALVAALVVLPVRRWWNQRADLADRKSELDILRAANAELGSKVAALNTPEGIEAEARTALNFGYPGEERTRSVGDPQAPIVLPAGFPYSLVNSILASRVNLAAAPPSPDPTAAADPAASGAPADSSASPTTPEPTIAPPPGNPLTPAP
jgi:cell division protein FtsB